MRRSTIQSVVACLASAGCLVWLFYDVNWPRLLEDMSGIDWGWVSLAIALNVISYLFQGWRWQLLMRPKGSVSAWSATEAIYVGLFANSVLPLRVGELVRGYLMARRLKVDFSAILPSIVVERLFDGIWMALSIGAAAIFVRQLPPNVLKAGDILGWIVLVYTVLFLFAILRKGSQSKEVRFRWLRGPAKFFGALAADLREIGRSRALYLSFAVSFLLLLAQIAAFWLVMPAYGIRLSFLSGAVVLLIMHLGTMIPNAPANLGTYQVFTVIGLELFGVEKTLAAGFSLVAFFLLSLPLAVIGAIAAGRTGMTLAGMRAVGRTSSHTLAAKNLGDGSAA